MALNIVSLNVNGMREAKKRTAIYEWLRIQDYDICMLQETHCSCLKDVKTWSKEWKGKAYWSPGTNTSRGVAFLIKHNLDLVILESDKDPNGRFLSIDVKVDDLQLSFINIYAPNNSVDRKSFFRKLNEKI